MYIQVPNITSQLSQRGAQQMHVCGIQVNYRSCPQHLNKTEVRVIYMQMYQCSAESESVPGRRKANRTSIASQSEDI